MSIFRINEYFCVLCQDAIPSNLCTAAKLFIFSSKADIAPLDQCIISTTSRQEASLVHESCLREIGRPLSGPNAPPYPTLESLRILSDTSRSLWPIPKCARERRARRIAGDAFADLVKTRKPTSSMLDSLQALAPELLRQIGQFTYPSAVSTLCVLRKSAIMIASTCSEERSSRILCPSDRRLRISYRTILYDSYVADIEDSGMPLQDASEAFILSYDDIACISIVSADQGDIRTGSWYRKIWRDARSALSISYKVCMLFSL